MELSIFTPNNLELVNTDLMRENATRLASESIKDIYEDSIFSLYVTETTEFGDGIVDQGHLNRFYAFLKDAPPDALSKADPDYLSTLKSPNVLGMDANPNSTLWLTDYISTDPFADAKALTALINGVFSRIPSLSQILLALPADSEAVGSNTALDDVLMPVGDSISFGSTEWAVYLSVRGPENVPTLGVRHAAEEDFDDLVPIFKEQADVLAERYGEFFLADIIRSTTPGDVAFVAEHRTDAGAEVVGFLSLSKTLDVDLIRVTHDLSTLTEIDKDSTYSVDQFCIVPEHTARSVDFLLGAVDMLPDLKHVVATLPADVAEFPLVQEMARLDRRWAASTCDAVYVYDRNTQADRANVTVTHDTGDAYTVAAGGQVLGSITAVRTDVAKLAQSFIMPPASPGVGAALFEVTRYGLPPVTSALSRTILAAFMRLVNAKGIIASAGPDLGALYELSWPLRPQTLPTSPATHPSAARVQLGLINPASDMEAADGAAVRAAADAADAAYDRTVSDATDQWQRPARILLKRDLMHRKTVVNRPIVIVGTGTTTWALLEHLHAAHPYLILPNITVIGPGGLTPADDGLLHPVFTVDRITRSGIGMLAASVDGYLVGIDRTAKAVLLADTTAVRYDSLIITEGLADQTLTRLGVPPVLTCRTAMTINSSDGVVSDILQDLSGGSSDIAPTTATEQLFAPKNAADVRAAIEAARCLETTDRIVVYGLSCSALAAVSALLDAGIAGHRITLAIPHHPDASQPIAWEPVANRINDRLLTAGVEVIPNVSLAELGLDEDARLANVRLVANTDVPTVTLDDAATRAAHGAPRTIRHEAQAQVALCRLLVTLDVPQVDPLIFAACNSTSMVYDGGLVINGACETSDPAILACSDMAKLSRRCGATVMSPSSASPVDWGRHLASRIVDRAQGVDVDPLRTRPILFTIPDMTAMKVVGATYIHIEEPIAPVPRKPGRTVTHETPDVLLRVEYSDVHGIQVVRALTLLVDTTAVPQPDPERLLPVVTMPDSMLHNMLDRIDADPSFDPYQHLHAAWLSPMMNEDVQMMLTDVGEDLMSSHDVRNIVDRLIEGSLEPGPALEARMDKDSVKLIRTELFKFFNENRARYPTHNFPSVASEL